MELYRHVAYRMSKELTEAYSTSFSMSSRLFASTIRPDIYAVYGLVRIADEIVDTYNGDDEAKRVLLDDLERQTYDAIEQCYSANPIVHAFALTASRYSIGHEVIAAFFASMRMDIGDAYTTDRYQEYIYGSAEAVGLMCLKVFCEGDQKQYDALEKGARALGSAYQKVNFLRDMATDYHELGRVYFPGVTFETFDDVQKRAIEQDITDEFELATGYIDELPISARNAVRMSYEYYHELLLRIARVSAGQLCDHRVRVPNARKLWLLVSYRMRART